MKKISFFQKIDLEEILLLAFLLLLPFHLVLKKLLPHPLGTYWKEGVLSLLFLAWLLRSLRGRKLLIPGSALDLPVFLYLCLLLLHFATDRDFKVKAWGFYITAMYLPLYWVASHLIQRRQNLALYTWLVILAGAIVSLGGILEYALNVTLWPSEEIFSRQGFYEVYIYATSIRRVYFTFDSPTTLANYLALLLPLAAILMPAVKGWLARTSLIFSSFAILFCLILTFSRGLWVAVLVALVGMGLLTGLTERTLRYIGYTVGVAVLTVALWFGIAALTPTGAVSTYQNVVELTDEAFATLPVQKVLYNFLEHEAKKGKIEVQNWSINDPILGKKISYPVLLEHPPEEGQEKIVYQVQVPPEGALRFSLALAPEVWIPDKGDGVTFSVYVEQPGQEKGDFIFVRYLNPKNDITDRKWRNFLVNLASYAGQTVELSFITEPGPRGNNAYDWAGWANPQIVVVRSSFFENAKKENAVVSHAGSIMDWDTEETNVDRLRAWQKSLLVFRRFFLWGAGLGRTGVASLRTMPDQGFVTESQWLKMAVEMGLLGLLVFAFLWYRIFQVGYSAYLETRHPLHRAILLGTLTSLLVIFLNGLVFQNLEVKQVNAYFWFFAAVIAALEKGE